jgi:hypothetical protein
MELEDGEVAECIDDIIEILEDPKELRGRPEAQEAVKKLKQVNYFALSYVRWPFFRDTTRSFVFEICINVFVFINIYKIIYPIKKIYVFI